MQQPPTSLELHSTPRDDALAARLERGEIVAFDPCPFTAASDGERSFLFEQQLGGPSHKNISYNPATGRAAGYARQSAEQENTLVNVLGNMAGNMQNWLAQQLPRYAQGWQVDRLSYRPDEEATRRLRLTARNDLLHIDAFPSRPTQGARILRLFVNLNPAEARVWVSSDPIATLLERFANQVEQPSESMSGWLRWLGNGVAGWFQESANQASDYDHFMLRLHHFLKKNDDYQEQARKKFWHFPPGSAWLLFSDGVAHADLRGQFLVDLSFFVGEELLLHPNQSPHSLWKNRTHSHAAMDTSAATADRPQRAA